jgi:hypothetical protein
MVRRAVDDGAPAGGHLLTGSAVPVEQPVHPGAGRIVTLRMRPLSLPGFPGVRSLGRRARRLQLDARLADGVVITTGADADRRPDEIAVVPAAPPGP